MSSSNMKIDLKLHTPMKQYDGHPILDPSHGKKESPPPNLKPEEFQKWQQEQNEKQPPLYIGVFLSLMTNSTKTIEGLTGLQRAFVESADIFKATMAKVEAEKAGSDPEKVAPFEVDEEWLTKKITHIDKERASNPDWNNSTLAGQLSGFLESAKVDLANKVRAAKGQ